MNLANSSLPSPTEPMRRCGKRYTTRDAALASKRAQDPTMVVLGCWCDGFHVRKRRATTVARMAAAVSKPTPYTDTIPPRIRKLVDARDSVDGVRISVLTGMAARWPHRHHRRLKGDGGDTRDHANCPCNLVTLDEGDHYWAHVLGRLDAEAEGFIVSGAVLFPGTVPVLRRSERYPDGVKAWPTCAGEWADHAPERLVAA